MSIYRKLSTPGLPSFQRLAALHGKLLLALLTITSVLPAQTNILPHHYIVVYRNAAVPADAEARIHIAGASLIRRSEHLGIASARSSPLESDDETMRRLAAQPNVDYVLHDRIVTASHLLTRPIPHPTFSVIVNTAPTYDSYYTPTRRRAGPSGRSADTATTSPAALPAGHGTSPWARASASPSSTAASTPPTPTSPQISP